MTRRLPMLLLLPACIAGCNTVPQIPDMPDPPQIVRVPVVEYAIPEWLIKPLPEDAPRSNKVEEATRLSCTRLGTIQVANCRFRLGARLRSGQPVDAADITACERMAVDGCEVSP